MPNNGAHSFGEKAKTWDNPARIQRAAEVADCIRSHVALSPAMDSFEYGCVTGLLNFALRPPLRRITMADNSHGMLQVARPFFFFYLNLNLNLNRPSQNPCQSGSLTPSSRMRSSLSMIISLSG